MISSLLELFFGSYYQSTKQVQVVSESKMGRFAFVDPKACFDCVARFPEQAGKCDQVVVCVDSATVAVEAIQLESIIGNFENLKAIPSGQKCDLLLVSDDKVVFCDMSCSMSKYINPFVMKDGTPKIGKRNMVRHQVGNSIALLHAVPEIAQELDCKRTKIALFAYRVKDEKPSDTFDQKVRSNMMSFGLKVDEISKEQLFSDIGYGYLFTETRYPNTYVW